MPTRRLGVGEDRGSICKSNSGHRLLYIRFHVLCLRGASLFKHTQKTNESTAALLDRNQRGRPLDRELTSTNYLSNNRTLPIRVIGGNAAAVRCGWTKLRRV